MGVSTRGIALGSPHSLVRLRTSVWPQSPPLRQSSPDSSKQRLKGFCATAGTVLTPPQGGNRGSPSIGPGTRLFQPLFSCATEGWQSMTHSRPASSETLPLQREVQDVDVEDYYVSDSSGRLVCHCRPERCPFSHSGRPAAQEVPSVCFWREGLSIQGSSLWPGFGTEDVHKMHGCCSGPFEAPGHSCTQLPGRLAHSGPLQGVGELSQGCHPPVDVCALGLRTSSKTSVLSPFQQTVFLGVHLDSVQMQALLASAQISSLNTYLARFKLDHHVSVCTCHRLLGLMAAASPMLPLGLLHMRPSLWWMKPLGFCFTGPATRLIMVSCSCFRTLLVWRPFSPEWSQTECDSPSPNGHDGHIPDRLGRGLRGQTGVQSLDRRVPLLAHKLPGAENFLPSIDSLSPLS